MPLTEIYLYLFIFLFSDLMNTTKIHNLDRIKSAIFSRPSGVPLITVANHESCIDDPCLISKLPEVQIPPKFLSR